MSVRVGIVGVSGYAGAELFRVLSDHPEVEVVALAARRAAGKPLSALWPGLGSDRVIEGLDAGPLGRRCDVVFLALPHGVSGGVAPQILEAGAAVIDLGADFRLRDPDVYASAYGRPHPAPGLLPLAVYGLPELDPGALAGARLIANPGCYPTAVSLAALPLVRAGLAGWLVADCISGISGAGRSPGSRNLYCEVQESATAYAIAGAHRHVPEIEQTLGVPVTFTPHLAPMRRGMLATVHARVPAGTDLDALYGDAYDACPLVTVRRDGPPATADVRYTANAHLHAAMDDARGVATIVCAIDNLGRGAAAQAVQNMNLSLGLPEALGLPTRAR